MAKANYTPAQLRACAIADQIREVLAIHPNRQGWICRPHHTNRQLKLGHALYGQDPYITSEVDTLCASVRHLRLGEDVGYEVVACAC